MRASAQLFLNGACSRRMSFRTDSVGTGYGFPSSHSQYMAYFATFLILHLYFRHRFVSTGYYIVDVAWLLLLHLALIGWAGVVAYSRYVNPYHLSIRILTYHLNIVVTFRLYLTYHSPPQVLWGVSLGIAFGVSWYSATELIPTRMPDSSIGKLRSYALDHPISQWFRLRDGWLVWPDGGVEEHWQAWAKERERLRLTGGQTKAKRT